MQINKILVSLICLSTLATGCNVVGSSNLKRSSSNKLFDMDGFHGNKRRPIYNKKYINKAKKNIIVNDYDEDEETEDTEELINPQRNNIKMYKNMIKGRANSQERKEFEARRSPYVDTMLDEDEEVDLIRSRKRLSNIREETSKEDLEMEIVEIKELLKKTRDEITKAKCPYTEESKNNPARTKNKQVKSDSLVPARSGAMTAIVRD